MHEIIQQYFSSAQSEGYEQISVGPVFTALCEQLGKEEAVNQAVIALEFDIFLMPPGVWELNSIVVGNIMDDIASGVDMEHLSQFKNTSHGPELFDQPDLQNGQFSDGFEGYSPPAWRWD